MPVILVNNATSIEIDISAALKYTINKGDFDVILEYTGLNAGMVVIVLRSAAITNNHFYLDWRDISSPLGITSAEQLRDLLLSWNTPSVIISGSLPLPAGAATAENQTNGTQKALILGSDGSIPMVEDRKQTPTGKALNVQIGPGDPISNIPVMIDFEHHQIHEGESHKALDQQLAIGVTTVKYAITVPNFVQLRGPHMVVQVDTYNGAARVDIYEDATFTGGTPVASRNKNRNSAIVPATTITKAVTSTNGTLIESFLAGSAARAAGPVRQASEWILKTNAIYRVDVIGLITGSVAIVSFNWYEDLGV